MTETAQLKVKLFADGADLSGIKEMAANPAIKGFTTNPTLMRKAGIGDYKAFALQALRVVGGRPISFEVFADDFGEIRLREHVVAKAVCPDHFGDGIRKERITDAVMPKHQHFVCRAAREIDDLAEINKTAKSG